MSNNKLGLSRLVFIPVTIEFSGIREQTFWYFCRLEVRSLQHTAEMTHLCSMKSARTSREDLKGWRLFTCLGADIAWRLLHFKCRGWAKMTERLTQAGTLLVCLYGLITLLRYLPVGRLGYEKGSSKNKHFQEKQPEGAVAFGDLA